MGQGDRPLLAKQTHLARSNNCSSNRSDKCSYNRSGNCFSNCSSNCSGNCPNADSSIARL